MILLFSLVFKIIISSIIIVNSLAFIIGIFHLILYRKSERLKRLLEINKSLFKTDSNLKVIQQYLQLLSRFTWEFIQTLIGYLYFQILNIFIDIKQICAFGGATFALTKNASIIYGISLCNYVHIAGLILDEQKSLEKVFLHKPILMHEYGHYLDSKIFGPFYLLFIGLPSIIGGRVQRINEPFGILNHHFKYVERRANIKAAKYFKKYYNLDWNSNYLSNNTTIETYYPTKKR